MASNDTAEGRSVKLAVFGEVVCTKIVSLSPGRSTQATLAIQTKSGKHRGLELKGSPRPTYPVTRQAKKGFGVHGLFFLATLAQDAAFARAISDSPTSSSKSVR